MTGFLVNLLSPVFSSLGVSQADLTSYIEKLDRLRYRNLCFTCCDDRSNGCGS